MHGQQVEDGSFRRAEDEATNANMRDRIAITAFVLTCLSDVQHDDIVRALSISLKVKIVSC